MRIQVKLELNLLWERLATAGHVTLEWIVSRVQTLMDGTRVLAVEQLLTVATLEGLVVSMGTHVLVQ